ncbi:unnamed protein product [Clavelina lepadiformis]|uniref:Uncharacterized protein n=1 Tax=Clavelina lepadiformis TaxID=159417 RepID=A0ABP0FEA7_CLALP
MFWKISVWVLVILFAGDHLNELVQSTMVEAGILKKPIKMEDACNLEILPAWLGKAIGCRETKKEVPSKKGNQKLKITLDNDLMGKFKFETREKSWSEKLTDYVNKGFVYVQRLILPEKFVMPCILGDCDMASKIKKDKEKYSNMLYHKIPTTPPNNGEMKKASSDDKKALKP